MKKMRVFLMCIVSLLAIVSASAKSYSYDELLGSYESSVDQLPKLHADRFMAVIEDLRDGDVVKFSAREYIFEKFVDIKSGLTLEGVGEMPERGVVGAGEISTRFIMRGGKSFRIAASNVTMRNIYFEAEPNKGGIIAYVGVVENLLLENLHLYQSLNQINGSKSYCPGMVCRNVTFEKLGFRGIGINRSEADTPESQLLRKVVVENCYFSNFNPLKVHVRAISIDAGNTEDPNIWDFDGMEVKGCHFEEVGFASSKCRNFKLLECSFHISKLYDAPLHLEEYTSDVLISGCKFTCDDFRHPLIQALNNSRVVDNVATGRAKGFMQGGYAENYVIENNDLSKLVSTHDAISLWNGGAGSRNIRVKNNKLNGGIVKILVTEEFKNTIEVDEPTATTVEIGVRNGYTYPFEEGQYTIRNSVTGEYLSVDKRRGEVVASRSINADTKWELKQVWPDRYEVRSASDGSYLYVYKGSEGQRNKYKPNDPRTELPLMTRHYDDKVRKPIWDLSTPKKGSEFNILAPGGDGFGVVGAHDGAFCGVNYNPREKQNEKYTKLSAVSLWIIEKCK